MASPFNVFRKHQKVILVAAGVLCMFVFVIGDVLFQFVGTGSGGDGRSGGEDMAVEWNGGSLTRLEMDSLRTRRNILRNFLTSVQQLGIDRSGGTSPTVRPLGVTRQSLYHPVEEEIVLRHLMAEKAQGIGIVVSDAAINNYLSQLAQGQVSSEELRGLVSNLAAGGRRVGMNYIFEAMREEMLADTYLDSYAQAVQTVTPAQRWEDWQRLNDRVVVESMAVPVGNFVDEVPDPTDADLRAFFEKYKDREPTPVSVHPFTQLPSPDPAFRIPRMVEIHYIEADYQTVAKAIEPEVTDEEIRQYYEQHKDPEFIRPQLDLGIEGDMGGTTQPVDGLPPEPPEEDPSSSANPFNVDPPSSSGSTETDESAMKNPIDLDPPTATGEDPTAAPSPGDAPQGSHLYVPAHGPTHYVAYQVDAAVDAATEAATPKAASKGLVELGDTSGAAESEDPLTSENVIQTAPPSTTEGATADAVESATEDTFDGKPPGPVETVDVEFLPLDVVRDEIRESIARDRVEAKLLEIMPLINSDLLTIYRQFEDRRLDAEEAGEDLDEVAPPELDLASIAEEYGLVAKQMAPMSYYELRETPVGRSRVREGSAEYSTFAFSQPLYQPAWTVEFPETLVEQMQGGFTQYIALKVADTEAREPTLTDIRDDVVREFKRVKARDKAFAKAEELAKKADQSAESLVEQFAGNEQYVPLQSDPFSWYESEFGAQIHLAKPFGVDHAGPEFFETVFSLAPGKAAAVWNHDKSVAYVVRLVRHQQSEDALRNRFLIEGLRPDLFQERITFDLLRGLQLRQALERSILMEAGVR